MKTSLLLTTMMVVMVIVTTVHADFHKEEYEEPGRFDSIKQWFQELSPFGARLGHDWSETQDKVENIYRETHAMAQRRADDLKEEALKSKELREQIAEIYSEAAHEAERRIDRLKGGLLASLTRHYAAESDKEGNDDKDDKESAEGSSTARKAFNKAKDAASDKFSSLKEKFSPKQQHSLFDETTKKIGLSYRSALDKAKESLGSIQEGTGDTLSSTKAKAKKLYDEAFHQSHGEARSAFGKLRDAIGAGFHRATHLGKSATCKTWNMFTHIGLGLFWLVLGAAAYSVGMFFWNRQQYNRQLNSHMPGSVIHVQEYMVFGNEQLQRKWLDFWTTTGAAFFNKQGGLRKFALHRGVEPMTKKWTCIGEWNSVDDLRNALKSPEFADLKRRAPTTVLSKETIVTAVGVGGKEETASVPGPLRQRSSSQIQSVS